MQKGHFRLTCVAQNVYYFKVMSHDAIRNKDF